MAGVGLRRRTAWLIGRLIEQAIQGWVCLLGRPLATGETPWLDGPVATSPRVGAGFYETFAATHGLTVHRGGVEAGLIRDFDALRGPDFDPDQVDPRVVRFYERTASYQLDAWSQWSWLFRPFGWALISFVSRRMDQLNIPVSPLETSRGMSSEVVTLVDGRGETVHTGWLRVTIASGDVIYVGFYSIATPPRAPGPCVKVVFPVPRGNTTVILRPTAGADGSLRLVSTGRGFGDSGFYRTVMTGRDRARVRYIRAMKEVIHVFVDERGVLRTEHAFRFFRWSILTLHYKITPLSA